MFRPATFAGRPIASITEAWLSRTYGKPASVYVDPDRNRFVEYRDIGEWKGKYMFVFHTKRLGYVELTPAGLSIERFKAWAGHPISRCKPPTKSKRKPKSLPHFGNPRA